MGLENSHIKTVEKVVEKVVEQVFLRGTITVTIVNVNKRNIDNVTIFYPSYAYGNIRLKRATTSLSSSETEKTLNLYDVLTFYNDLLFNGVYGDDNVTYNYLIPYNNTKNDVVIEAPNYYVSQPISSNATVIGNYKINNFTSNSNDIIMKIS